MLLLGVLLLLPLAAIQAPAPDSPIAFGRAELGAAAARVAVELGADVSREGYRIEFQGARAQVRAADEAGAMYGLLEMAERVRMRGEEAAFTGSALRGQPFLQDRGYNLFLTLPWDYAANGPDYDPVALGDPARWWFHDEDYWRTLLDEMARSRLNWLDIHGSYDLHTTRFPNLYAYFVKSASFPEVGVADDLRARNLARLNRVIELAHARGIRVSLMSYEARFYTPHNPSPPYSETEEADYLYTKEVVEAMIRGAPGLDAIGFRIGESGHGGDFFRCYLEAVEASGRDVPLYTRSWITRKRHVVPLAAASSDFTVEIKYNGEQWGPPYPLAGGRVPGWYSYSFEDYLSDSNSGEAARWWPGNETERGGAWPRQPYKIVWQVRANGTHRIFPFYEPDWVRGTVRSMKLGSATGYTVEPLNAYFPASPDYYLADPRAKAYPWIHQRDRMYLRLWGRLGYDPDTPEEVFQSELDAVWGTDAPRLASFWKAASRVIPTAFSAFAFGPDHRDHAPELEWGGPLENVLQTEPFDAHVFRSAREELAYQATGGRDGRLGPGVVAEMLEEARRVDRPANRELGPWAVEVRHAGGMRLALAAWYASRLRGARLLAEIEAGEPGADAGGKSARLGALLQDGLGAWLELAASGYYRPFTDRLRMGKHDFHWRDRLAEIEEEARRWSSGGHAAKEEPRSAAPAAPPAELSWEERDGRLLCSLQAPGATRAWLLHKPLPSSTFFHKTPMQQDGAAFTAVLPRQSCGHLLACEVEANGEIRRLPAWLPGPPYWVVPARPGPTPYYYSSEEALAYLQADSLKPDRHGLLLVAQRAWNFFRGFDVAVQRKVLEAVERGMTLLVLQQDYTSGRYPLAWLPEPLAVQNVPAGETGVFEPDGALGLERVETPDVLWQRFAPSPGWEIHGNGGVAWRAHGRGQIWLVQARLMQRMHVPAAARNLLKLLQLGGTGQPVVLLDAGSEGARYSSSIYPDFLNAHEILFLTLGELIAEEQGMDSMTPVPGRPQADRILEGRGTAELNAWLERQVKQAAARPLPQSRAELEQRKDEGRRRLLRGLGLDPLPERTPLNARITGGISRDGYRVEKLAFESRPGFYVTAHLYVPDGPGPFPVLLNPHGHWRHKKSEPVVQKRLIAQALRGYLAVVVDSPGRSFEGDTPVERRELGLHDDWRLTLSAGCATGFYVWDLMRALDYLETRPEADLTRVGITGASGGGLAAVYAFAADPRIRCAVPVVYATSLEVNPHNGCLCNHVPGTLAIGDRADVLALRAPAPVLVIGAAEDPEFPAAGTRRTGEKLQAIWKLYGVPEAAQGRLFPGPHDYSQPMREAALGFFDLHLRGLGDGSPVPEPEIQTAPPLAPELYVLDSWPASYTTMAGAARERLQAGGLREAALGWSAGRSLPRPAAASVEILHEDEEQKLLRIVFPAAFSLPGVLWKERGAFRGLLLLLDDGGKEAAARRFDARALAAAGFRCLCLDLPGTGELGGMDLRLTTYLGTAPAAWSALLLDAALAAWPAPQPLAVLSSGPYAAQAALFLAAEGAEKVGFLVALDALSDYQEFFSREVTPLAIVPGAAGGPSLAEQRAEIAVPALWHFHGAAEPDWRDALNDRFPR